MADEGFKAVGGCRCDTNPVCYEYTKRPFEVHYCLCQDCTDVSGDPGQTHGHVDLVSAVTGPL